MLPETAGSGWQCQGAGIDLTLLGRSKSAGVWLHAQRCAQWQRLQIKCMQCEPVSHLCLGTGRCKASCVYLPGLPIYTFCFALRGWAGMLPCPEFLFLEEIQSLPLSLTQS